MFDVKKNNAEIKEVWNNTIEFGKKVAESEHVKKSNAAVKQAAEKIAETKAAQYIKNKSEEAGQKVKNETIEFFTDKEAHDARMKKFAEWIKSENDKNIGFVKNAAENFFRIKKPDPI